MSIHRLVISIGLVVLLITGWSSVAAGADEWQWQNPLPQGCSLNAVLGFSPTDIFAVGDNGAIVHFDGTDWQSMVSSSGRDYRLWSLWGLRNDDIFAVGWSGQILRFDGNQWYEMESGTHQDLFSVWGAASNEVFAVGSGGTILRYDGTSWEPMDSGTSSFLAGVWGVSGDDVYVVGRDGLILHYDGHAWASMASPTDQTLIAVWGADTSDIFAVGNKGTILRLVEGSWTTMASGTTGNLYDVWGWTGASVFALETYSNRIHHFDGSHWNLVHEDSATIRAIWGFDENDVYAVGGAGRILHKHGAAWVPLSSGNTSSGALSYLTAVWGTGADNVFAVGAAGRIHHFDGQHWARLSTPTGQFLSAVWGSCPDDVFAVGGYNDDNATILHFDGSVWSMMDPGTDSSLRGIWGTAADNVIAVGENGAIVHYDGASWMSMLPYLDVDIDVDFEGVWGARHDDVYAIGNHFDFQQSTVIPVVYHWDGVRWKEIEAPPATSLRSVWGTGSNSIFVGDSLGRIYRYDGEEWTYSGKTGFSYGVSSIWGLSERNLYAVSGSFGGTYGSGGIISRFDGGIWRSMTNDPVDPLYSVWGTGTGDVFAVGYHTTILHHDEGFAPEIVVAPSNLDFGAVRLGKTSDGMALRISNNGISWLEIDSAEITGVHAGSFRIRNDDCSATRLAPSAGCTVEIVFKSVSKGIKEAAISISSDDPGAPVIQANIVGSGALDAEIPDLYDSTD